MLSIENLIKKGFFPEEMIPVFNSSDLSKILNKIIPYRDTFKTKSSKCAQYRVPKQSQFYRTFSIPNPLHQIRLCHAITSNWSYLEEFYKRVNISFSKPIIKEKEESKRSIGFAYDRKTLIKEKIIRSCSYNFVLLSDISRFFHSIYTHSIPWSLHGKDYAKSNKSTNLIGNLIDRSIQYTQDKQTIGIPIGPDTSGIISEIIGTKIDIELSEKFKKINAIRFSDDFTIFTRNRSEAENILDYLNIILNSYELELNPHKTSILEMPISFEPLWLQEIRTYRFRNKPEKQADDLLLIFSKSFENCKTFKNSIILPAILNIFIDEVKIFKENWNLFESLLLHTLSIDSRTFPQVLKLIKSYLKEEYPVNKDKIKENFLTLLANHIPKNHGYEICWILWSAKELQIKMSLNNIKLDSINDPFSILILLDLIYSNLLVLDCSLKSFYQKFMNQENLYDPFWILSYEALRKGWLKNKRGINYLVNDDFFSILDQNDVSFFKDRPTEVIEISKLANELDYVDIREFIDSNYI